MTKFLSDSEKAKSDEFGIHTKIAELLTDTINDLDLTVNAFNIGLFGNWGSGKSYVVGQLENKLKGKENILFLNIDVWKFNGMPLNRSILFAISNMVDKQKFKDDFSEDALKRKLYYEESFKEEVKLTSDESKNMFLRLWDNYKWSLVTFFLLVLIIWFYPFGLEIDKNSTVVKFIEFFLIPVGGAYVFGMSLWTSAFKKIVQNPFAEILDIIIFRRQVRDFRSLPQFSAEQFEKTFTEMIKCLKNKCGINKVVIVFDNIDRCTPDFAYEALSTIKTFMDIKHCCYIIPCDDEALCNFLSDKSHLSNSGCNTSSFNREYAQEFLDKFFQVQFRIPVLKQSDRDDFIKKRFDELGIKELSDGKKLDQITQILYYGYKGVTPRQIKRFINDFAMYYYLAQKMSSLNLLDDIGFFTFMIVIKQRWIKIEQLMIENPNFLNIPIPQMEKMIDFQDDNANKNKDFLEFLKKISSWIDKEKSILPFIHFKETENDKEIIDKLKNVELKQINKDNFNTILSFFTNNQDHESLMYKNSLKNLSLIMIDNDDDMVYKSKACNLFWRNIAINKNYTKLDELYDLFYEPIEAEKITSIILRSLEFIDINEVEASERFLIGYLLSQEKLFAIKDSHVWVVFRMILSDNLYKFRKSSLEFFFKNLESLPKYLADLLNEVIKSGKNELVPNSLKYKIIESIYVDSNINSTYVDLISNFKLDHIALSKLSIFINSYITPILSVFNSNQNYQHFLKQIKPSNIIKVIDKLYIQTCPNLNQLLSIFINSYNAGVENEYCQDFIKTAMCHLKANDNSINNTFASIFKSHHDLAKKLLIKIDYSYLKLLFANSDVKNNIFVIKPDLYFELDIEDLLTDFKILLQEPLQVANVRLFMDTVLDKDNNIGNLKAIVEWILEKTITNIESNHAVVIELLKLFNEKQILDVDYFVNRYKNYLQDFYKHNPVAFIDLNNQINQAATYINDLVLPLYRFIKGKLDETIDVSEYDNIGSLIEGFTIGEELKTLISEITPLLLEDGQTEEEKQLARRLQELVDDSLPKENENTTAEASS